MKKDKVFIGLTDIASVVSEFKEGFAQNGIDTITACYNLNTPLQDIKVDYLIHNQTYIPPKYSLLHKITPKKYRYYFEQYPETIKKKVFQKAVKECNVFIFVWNSFQPNWKDLELLKKLGKKIVFLAMGSDVRIKEAYEQEMQKFQIPSFYDLLLQEVSFDCNNYNFQIDNIRKNEKYADLIFNLPNQAQLALRPYFHLYIPVLTKYVTEKKIQNKVPIIAHAPSRRGVKGTAIVFQVVEKLQQEGIDFKFQLIENVPHKEALKLYEETDVVVGELFIPSGGKLDREILAAGKVAMTPMPKKYIDYIPEDCPIIDINPDNLYHELKKIILDYTQRQELANKAKSYVKKYHESSLVAKKILDLLNTNPENLKYDYYPDFFRNEFKPPINSIDLFNQTTSLVKDCDWYKEYVPSGERDGLIF